MNRNEWEKRFAEWAAPPADYEEDKINNAVNAVRKAIEKDVSLSKRDIDVFVQGSYKNNVNVKKDSDVDIAVRCRDTFIYNSANGALNAELKTNISPATYEYSAFKNDVQRALVNYFGRNNVKRGNKAFNIKENTNRVDADAVAVFEYRYYYNSKQYREGVAIYSDDKGMLIKNYPEQHYENGVKKNDVTGRRFKRAVRIFKKLRYTMLDEGTKYSYLDNVPGYLLECLLYNTPTDKFNNESIYLMIRDIIFYLWDILKDAKDTENWTEVDELKYLFRSKQPWNREAVRTFFHNAWNYVGYQNA